MLRVGKLGAEAGRFREMQNSAQVLDVLEECFRFVGASGVLVTVVPLPGRATHPLLLHWPASDGEPAESTAGANDPLFPALLSLTRAGVQDLAEDPPIAQSRMVQVAMVAGQSHAICVPVRAFEPFQAAVVGFGAAFEINRFELLALQYVCDEAFRRLLGLGAVPAERPGDLSVRERKVVALSADGKTANDIAAALGISQRTVHAHLQNASEKLKARNKTQTVVEAIRYGQISL